MSKQTITINGTVYDAHTGLPLSQTPTIRAEVEKPAPVRPDSRAIHNVTQKSQTLNRRIVQKTGGLSPAKTGVKPTSQPSHRQSPAITKFAPHPSSVKPQGRFVSDIGPVSHPMAARANAHLAAKHHVPAPATPKPAEVIKNEAIAEAMDKAPGYKENDEKRKQVKKYPRAFSIGAVTLAFLLLGGYFTYLNMPSLSVRVAAAQAGIDASYPEYRPDGYGLHGPVAYSQNEVMMKFAANGGPQNFTITQAKSSWDSSAVLDNYVKQKAGDNYITYNERGLTIYTFDGNAAWVNGGVLYTIDGNAPLSTDQIRRIAISM